jgi:hypothetical protein
MLLFALIIAAGVAVTLMVSVHCVFFPNGDVACEREWGQRIREWMAETLPVIVALILGRYATRGPRDPPDDAGNE